MIIPLLVGAVSGAGVALAEPFRDLLPDLEGLLNTPVMVNEWIEDLDRPAG